jgi:hypothetical protein
LGNNGTGRNRRAVAMAVCTLNSFIILPVTTKCLFAQLKQKFFIEYLAGLRATKKKLL